MDLGRVVQRPGKLAGHFKLGFLGYRARARGVVRAVEGNVGAAVAVGDELGDGGLALFGGEGGVHRGWFGKEMENENEKGT